MKRLRLPLDRPRVAAASTLGASLTIVACLASGQAGHNRATAGARFTQLAQTTAERLLARLGV